MSSSHARAVLSRLDTDGQRSQPAGLIVADGCPVARFTLHGHHIAKLDRFVAQARRAAVRATRDFDGVIIEVDARGVVSVHALGLTAMQL